jgi:hypothetical protein
MQTKFRTAAFTKMALFIILLSVSFSCQKAVSKRDAINASNSITETNSTTPPFNLEVILRNDGNGFGLVKFRQDNDTARIINLDVWVRDLEPNHSYLLQRAADPITTGNCVSTAWLTLGKGLQPQAITTDDNGTGKEELWRDVTAIPRGSSFYIHFQVVDAVTLIPVLTSDCYQYT